MATRTLLEMTNALREIGELINDTLVHAEAVFVVNYDAAVAQPGFQTDFPATMLQGVDFVRNLVQAGFRRNAIRQAFGQWLFNFTHHVVLSPERDFDRAFTRTYDYFADNAVTLQSRVVVYNVVAAGGGNNGNHTVHRLTVDERGFALEAVHVDTYTLEIEQDATTGANLYEERFIIRGRNAGRDSLQVGASGLRRTDRLMHGGRKNNQVGSRLLNPSFNQGTYATNPTAGSPQVPTAITDWTVGNLASVQGNVDQIYRRGVIGQSTQRSLRMTAATTLSQALGQVAVRWNRARPAYLEIPVRRENAADGTLTITLGSKSQAFTVTGLTDNTATTDQFNVVRLDFDLDLWYRNWKTANATVTIAWTGRTVGELVFDDVLLNEWKFFDGTFYMPVASTSEPVNSQPLEDDSHAWSNAIASDAVLQKLFARGFGRSLPHSGTPSVTDP